MTSLPRALPGLLLFATMSLPAADAAEASNPLLAPSTLPFGYPAFDRVRDEHYAPAFTQGMAEHLREVEAIANNPAEPTFENTLVALERSGELLGRVQRLFFNLVGAHGNDALRAVEKEMAPKLSAHSDAIRLNPALFARVDRLHARLDQLGLDPESRRLLDRTHRDFVRSGARLGEAEKTRLNALNAEIATLQTTFAQNVLKETNASAVIVDRREELAGLSDAEIATAAAAAKAA
ncbi:MAG: dipeptidyl carboxypeptidase II, partial [Opitutaceae bacterium]